jgi:hypothetical protein
MWKVIEWFARWFWSKEEARVTGTTAKPLPPLVIGGYSIPESSVDRTVSAALSIVKGKMAGKSAADIFATIEPTTMAVVEGLANIFFPGAGTGIELVATIIRLLIFMEQNGNPMTQAQVNDWMSRSGAGFSA